MNAHVMEDKQRATFVLRGKRYPLNCSVKVIKEISKRHGSLEKFLAKLTDMPEAEQLDELIWVVHLMMEQGAALQRLEGGADITVPPIENFELLLGAQDIGGLYAAFNDVVGIDTPPTVELEEPEEKN